MVVFAYSPSESSRAEGTSIHFRPYKAYYTLSLLRQGALDVSRYEGLLSYEFTMNDCHYFNTLIETVDRMELGNGTLLSNHITSAMKESINGQDLWVNYNKDSASEGRKVYSSHMQSLENGVSRLIPSESEETILEQPVRIEFPVARFRSVIEAAIRGETYYAGYSYEGSDRAEDYFYGFTNILEETTESRSLPEGILDGDDLKTVRSWRLSSAFYDLDFIKDKAIKGDASPDLVSEEEVFSNGLLGSATLSYGALTILVSLNKVEWLPASPACGRN